MSIRNFKGGVWETNLDGILYLYRNRQGVLSGIYTRRKHAVVGTLHFGKDFSGRWMESDRGGLFKFDATGLLKNDVLSGYFDFDGSKERYPWNGRAVNKQSANNVLYSLLPFQVQWVQAFNEQKYRICASMYCKNGVFIMYHYPKRGQSFVARGRNEIYLWWKDVVETAKLRNMSAAPMPGKICVVDQNEVIVSYDSVTFDTPNPGKKFKGIIHCEQWVRIDGRWMVKRDVTEQTT